MSAEWPTAAEWLAAAPADEPAIAVAGLPLSDGAVTPSRYDLAPAAVRARLARHSVFDACHGGDLRGTPVRDLGDSLEPPPLTAPLTIVLGGHNGVTFETLVRQSDLARWGLLTLDAHHDVRRYEGRPGNGSPVRALIDAGLRGENVVQVGIHGFCNAPAHRQWCLQQGIAVHPPEAVDQLPVLLDDLARRCDRVYVDIDVDVLDRAYAPGCPGSRPGGLTPTALFNAAFAAGAHPAVAVVDLVEVDPEADLASVTVDCMAAALLHVASGFSTR